jgi:hypothetical protein
MKEIDWNLPDEESNLIAKIADRAKKTKSDIDVMSLEMDLTATHKYICQLRLDDLFHSDDFNFKHDVYGIMNNLDRQNLVLRNYFFPRFCASEKEQSHDSK